MNKIFDYGRHPGRKDTTESTANSLVNVSDPAFRADADDLLHMVHRMVKDKRNKLRNQQLDGGEPTDVDLEPELKSDTSVKSAPRGSSNAARSLRPNSKPEPVILKVFLEKLLTKAKKNRRIVQLPPGLSASNQFPELLHKSVEDRMNSCRTYLKLLNDWDRETITTRAKNIHRWVREVRKPIVEQRAFEWELARQERERQRAEIKEGVAGAVGVLAMGIAKSAAKQAFGSTVVDLATKAMRAVKAKPLRTIAPVKIVSGRPKKTAMSANLKPTSGVKIIGPDEPRTQIGQLRQVPPGSILTKNSRGGSTWSKKIMS